MINERKKFKDLKFIQLVISHKKIATIIGITTVLLIAIIIPIALSNRAYKGDFEYAYNAYKEETQPDLDNRIIADFEDGVVTEIIDEKEATLSSIGVTTDYKVNVIEEGKYSLYISNKLSTTGFKDSEFEVYIDNEIKLERGKIRAYLKNSSEEFKLDSYA